MASIKKLQPGQTVWSVRRQKVGRTLTLCKALFPVTIEEVHKDYVVASWNGNNARKYTAATVRKWKVDKPEPKKYVFGTPSY